MSVTSETLREALGHFATGVAVITGMHPKQGPVGLTISSFNSVSIDPPLILWSLASHSPSREAFGVGRNFSVNVLSGEQERICRQFARPCTDKFKGVKRRDGVNGITLLEDAAAVFECRSEKLIPAGDHDICIGRVLDIHINDMAIPLIFHRSRLFPLPATDGIAR